MRKRDIVRHLGRRVIRRVSGVSYNHFISSLSVCHHVLWSQYAVVCFASFLSFPPFSLSVFSPLIYMYMYIVSTCWFEKTVKRVSVAYITIHKLTCMEYIIINGWVGNRSHCVYYITIIIISLFHYNILYYIVWDFNLLREAQRYRYIKSHQQLSWKLI